jgi:hypothetical protein
MDIVTITRLIADKEWTKMLKSLPEGEHTLPFRDVKDIRSCKAIAYDINSNGPSGRKYYFNVDKRNLTVRIRVLNND